MNPPPTYLRAFLALLTVVAFVISACTSTPAQTDTTPPEETSTTGTLDITVTGLPDGTPADILVGDTAVTTSTSLELEAGDYPVLAEAVLAEAEIMGDRLTPDTGSTSVNVTVEETTSVTIDYSLDQEALLLVPNYDGGTINVLNANDLGRLNASSAWNVGSNSFTGMALGPDGRLYVSDYGNSAIFVIDAADLATDGTVTPIAEITVTGFTGPMGAAFDSEGSLWVGSYSGGAVARLDGVQDVTADEELAPSFVLTVDPSGGALAFSTISDVFVDHLDNVWVSDNGFLANAVYRFEDVMTRTDPEAVAPALFLENSVSSISGTSNTLDGPSSLIVDIDGTLYVGRDLGSEVSRFDNALALTGTPTIEASAYLDTGIASSTSMVSLDQSGALWVGHDNGALVRVPNPGTYTGLADVNGQIDRELSWYTAGGSGSWDGGTMEFVPTQGPIAGY